jgi:nucleoside-diphosphate-sugar epimerase
LAIVTNVIEASRRTGVAKLLFLGSSCIYLRLAPSPMPGSRSMLASAYLSGIDKLAKLIRLF